MTRCTHIVAVGARTPVGLQVAPAAAAVRAGLNMFGDHPFMVDQVGDKMPAALDAEIDPAIFGSERMLLLAEPALREACAVLAKVKSPVKSHVPQLPLLLALPEYRPGFSEKNVDEILAGLGKIKDLPVPLSKVFFFVSGHAAGLSALAQATEQINQGALDACLVGGVESYFHPDTMEWLDANRQLVGTVSRSGFIPGEGAGFCLLVSETLRDKLGLPSLAIVRAAVTGQETKLIKTDDMCFGEGLTATVRQAVSSLKLPDERIHAIICDINGERYRGEEWGFVCLRLSHYFDDPTAYVSPAENWGDMGAASGPLFAMLACQAAMKGYAPGHRTLLFSSSEQGLRSVVVLENPEPISGKADAT